MNYRTKKEIHYAVAGMHFPAFVIPAHTPCTPAANLPPPQPGFRPYFWLSHLPASLIDNWHAANLMDGIGILMLPDEVEEEPLLLPEKSPVEFHVGDHVFLAREGLHNLSLWNGCTAIIEEVVPAGNPVTSRGETLKVDWYRLKFPFHSYNAMGARICMYRYDGEPYILGRTARNLRHFVPAQI